MDRRGWELVEPESEPDRHETPGRSLGSAGSGRKV